MKLKGQEKHFWWNFGQITDTKDIPAELPGFTSIDSLVDDAYLEMLAARVSIVHEIYLKATLLTDAGVAFIAGFKQLKRLTLMKHEGISKACLPYLNTLTDLEYLDVWRTQIRLADVGALTHLTKLKELIVSVNDEDDDSDREAVLELIIRAEEALPNCSIYTSPQ